MTVRGSADVGFLLVNGMNILGDMTQIEDEQTAVMEETTPLGTAAQTHEYVGVSDYVLSQDGFYNDAANRSNAALVGIGTAKVISYAPEGNVLGGKIVTGQMIGGTYKRQIQRGTLTKAAATYMSRGAHDEGIILHPLGEETEDGDTTGDSQDNTTSSSNGAAGVLQLTALDLDGYDDLLVKIQDSSDDMSYADLIAFTAKTTAPAAERKEVTGSVDRYVACIWEFEGSGTDPSATFAVGFARK